jgi:hypothetical protein
MFWDFSAICKGGEPTDRSNLSTDSKNKVRTARPACGSDLTRTEDGKKHIRCQTVGGGSDGLVTRHRRRALGWAER